jgi:hypothetical protein
LIEGLGRILDERQRASKDRMPVAWIRGLWQGMPEELENVTAVVWSLVSPRFGQDFGGLALHEGPDLAFKF